MAFTWTFIEVFAAALWLISPVLIFLSVIVLLLSQLAGRVENWKAFDAFYWGIVTATTVGYGDIRPLQPLSRLISLVIAIVGLTFTGIWVAIAIEATTAAFELHTDPQVIEQLKQEFEPGR
ncbi:potassium channel family protein [Bacterioplanoides sp.]|uniref:potassium channel family protein n=1 Tax=Bacterioplanoides sp. TaxID=2066072 RepID=UPI003B5A3D6B